MTDDKLFEKALWANDYDPKLSEMEIKFEIKNAQNSIEKVDIYLVKN